MLEQRNAVLKLAAKESVIRILTPYIKPNSDNYG